MAASQDDQMHHDSQRQDSSSKRQTVSQSQQLMIRVWACFGIALFATTWRLWTPQDVFPQIPLFEWATAFPPVVDWVAFMGVLICLIVVAVKGYEDTGRWSWSFATFALCLSVLFLIDQHRLQPWAWHWFVFAIILSLVKLQDAMVWFRWIVISIYLFSALSKLDYQFTHTVGLEMLNTIVNLAGLSLADWSPESTSRLVMLLPLVELVTGIGLMFAVTRVACGWLAILLHGGLLLTLGPLGMNHQPPVLIWNTFFIFQAYWLFVRPSSAESAIRFSSFKSSVAAGFATSVILFPATSSFGLCDHWLAWELYAPRSSRVTIELPASAVEQLPHSVRAYAKQSPYLPGVVRLDLAQWSLQQLGVPVYPQSRFQLGVARAVGAQLNNDGSLRITEKSQSDRRTGKRSSVQVRGANELEKQTARFWLNTRPRVRTDRPLSALSRR